MAQDRNKIDPGTLDRRVVIERPRIEGDAGAGESVAWEPLATVWAAIIPQRASERLVAMQETALAFVTIRIRSRSDIDPTMRVSYKGAIFNIRNVPIAPRLSGFLDLDCEMNAAT